MDENEPFVMPPSFNPGAIVCSRRVTDKKRPDFGSYTYDAELRIYGVQYVLQTGMKTREEAQKHGDWQKQMLVTQLEAVVSAFVKGLKEAKP